MILPILGLTLLGCTENTFHPVVPDHGGELGSVTGRVCDQVTQSWLTGALVYTNLSDGDGAIYDTRIVRTDEEGRWELEALPGELDYDIYIQHSGVIIENFEVHLDGGEDLELDDPECFGEVDVAIAVITGDYDEFDTLLEEMGAGTPHVVNGLTGSEITDFLTDAESLAEFNAIFFNGGHIELGVIVDDGSEGSAATVEAIKENVKGYVEGGGTLIATDWAYDVIEQIWEGKMEFLGDDTVVDAAQQGEPGTLTARVNDADLSAYLGADSVALNYDMAVWPVMESAIDQVTVYMEGTASYREGMVLTQVLNSPMMVGFTAGKGQVFFTTFRYGNSTNSSGEARQTLRYMLETIEE